MMPKTQQELLVVAIQDLWHARDVTEASLPAITEAASDAETVSVLAEIHAAARSAKAIFAAIVPDVGDTPNLWAQGILDDARRDVATTTPGPVRDVALIGAIRKLLAADIMSVETAACLATKYQPQHVEALDTLRTAACGWNRKLRLRLRVLVKP